MKLLLITIIAVVVLFTYSLARAAHNRDEMWDRMWDRMWEREARRMGDRCQ